jgi:hypothetical protein
MGKKWSIYLENRHRRGIMITVAVLINGQPIFTRSARNTGKMNTNGDYQYIIDTGDIIYHRREDGFVPLAKMMLDTIHDGDD